MEYILQGFLGTAKFILQIGWGLVNISIPGTKITIGIIGLAILAVLGFKRIFD